MKLKFYEWVILFLALASLILGHALNIWGRESASTNVFASGAFMFALFCWLELRFARRRNKEKDNE